MIDFQISNSQITVVKTSTVKLLAPSPSNAEKVKKRSSERSTQLLVGIVLVFLICHTVRLVIQIDAIIHPSTIGGRHYDHCRSKGRFHSPVAVWILTSFNVLCLVLNSRYFLIIYKFQRLCLFLKQRYFFMIFKFSFSVLFSTQDSF